eukprot:6180864-Pleurochrysis_carterae.AAC.4
MAERSSNRRRRRACRIGKGISGRRIGARCVHLALPPTLPRDRATLPTPCSLAPAATCSSQHSRSSDANPRKRECRVSQTPRRPSQQRRSS